MVSNLNEMKKIALENDTNLQRNVMGILKKLKELGYDIEPLFPELVARGFLLSDLQKLIK